MTANNIFPKIEAGTLSPVDTPADLAPIANPAEGDRRFVRSFGYDYQFAKTYIQGNPWGQIADDGTIGIWQPAFPPQMSDQWLLTASNRNDLSTYFTRKLIGATVESIRFEVNQPASPNVETIKTVIDIPDFQAIISGAATFPETTVSNPSGYYGGPTLFIKPGGTSIIPVCVRADGTVIIHNQNTAGSIVGLIRRVKINGIPANPIYGA